MIAPYLLEHLLVPCSLTLTLLAKATSVGSLVMPYDIGAFRPDPAVSGGRLIALHEAFCRFAGGIGGGGDGVGFDQASCLLTCLLTTYYLLLATYDSLTHLLWSRPGHVRLRLSLPLRGATRCRPELPRGSYLLPAYYLLTTYYLLLTTYCLLLTTYYLLTTLLRLRTAWPLPSTAPRSTLSSSSASPARATTPPKPPRVCASTSHSTASCGTTPLRGADSLHKCT